MDESQLISSKERLKLDLPPSCMQFCPQDPAFFVVGTYNLQKEQGFSGQDSKAIEQPDDEQPVQKKTQNRNGSLIVFALNGDKISKVQTESQPSALLDLRFHPHNFGDYSILATVSSTGTLAVFTFDPKCSPPLSHIATSRCEDLGEDVLFLQCNWHPSIKNMIAVTTSAGQARLLRLDDKWSIHEWTELGIENSLEAWCIALSEPRNTDHDTKSATAVYCGGDDSQMRCMPCLWTVGQEESGPETPYSAVTIKGQHEAGVTSILPLPRWTADGGRLVVTGSYDDCLRLFAIHDLQDTYGMKRVKLLAEVNLGGGVWRLNLIDSEGSSPDGAGSFSLRVLVSCMHAGARIVQVRTEDWQAWECKVLARFEEHKSMNYASDFIRSSGSTGGLTCVSTSFYDQLLCLWDYGP